jgi:hypothetical protein
MAKTPREIVSSIKESAHPEYSKDQVRLLASNPQGAQDFIHSTNNYGGASINLASGKVAQPGENLFLVGKEPSQRSGYSVPTQFEGAGSLNPNISAHQFSSHFLRLKGETSDPKAMMGSWVDTKSKKSRKKGVQIDLSTGHKYQKTAEKKMITRNEDAVWNMKNMRNIRNEAARKRHGITEPRPPKEN